VLSKKKNYSYRKTPFKSFFGGGFGELTNLKIFLTSKELVLAQIIGWAKEHVDHDVVQIGLRTRAPLHNNKKGQVPE